MTFLRSTKGRALRRGFPIHGYVGPNGGGKTCAMIWDTMPALEAGRPVLSTVRLLDYTNPRPCEGWISSPDLDGHRECPICARGDDYAHGQAHPLWLPFTSWRQLIDFRAGDVLMDEVTGVASSRDSHTMPSPILNHLMQLRRADVTLRFSAPAWRRADTGIREVCQAVTSCKGLLKKAVPAGPGEEQRVWHHRRLFVWKTFDAYQFEDFTTSMTVYKGGAKPRLRALKSEMHWGPDSPAFAAYDTFDAVLAIGAVSVSGRCMTCDGRRSAPACSCDDYEPPRRTRSVRDGAAAGAPRSGVSGCGGPSVDSSAAVAVSHGLSG